jgi:cbb3-type cytochrome oxidase cytochrome c subunit
MEPGRWLDSSSERHFLWLLLLFFLIFASGCVAISLKPQSVEPTSPGWEIFIKKGCNTCHQIKGIGKEFGPDLSNIGLRRNISWLDAWLRDPKLVKPAAKMPKPLLSDTERKELVNFLASQK